MAMKWGIALKLCFKILLKTPHKKWSFALRISSVNVTKASWSFLWIWSHLLKNSLMENFIFCAVKVTGMPKKVKLREIKKIWKEKLSHSSYYQNYLDVLQNHSKIKIPWFTTKSSSLVRWKRQSHFTLKELWLRLAHLVC